MYNTPHRSFELAEKKQGRFQAPLITQEPVEIIMPNYLRSCTDVVCLGVLVLVIGGFVGLLIYGLVAGSPLSVISIYNGDRVRCDQNANFPCKSIINVSRLLPQQR
jgi:hypothetical protein